MNSSLNSDLQQTVETALGLGMDVVFPGDEDYDTARQVYNRRIQNTPYLIAYCETAEHVSFWFQHFNGAEIPIVVRSGGHHHEGMCTESGAIVVDVSKIQHCDVSSNKSKLDVGPGKGLGELISEIAGHSRVLPTGGCKTVCVGGLTHGGGWGASYRHLGLTVDKLLEVEIVLPTGDIIRVNKDGLMGKGVEPKFDDHSAKLFWAIRGGGGGNFGVVTNFVFELTKPPKVITQMAIQWDRKHMVAIAQAWMGMQATADTKLTTACRFTVVDEQSVANPVILLGGIYYGDPDHCKAALEPLYAIAKPTDETFIEVSFEDTDAVANALMDPFTMPNAFALSAPDRELPAQAYSIQVGARSRTQRLSNCEYEDDPEPHKVSSMFPKGPDHDAVIAEAIEDYLKNFDERKHANIYMSLHGLGGQGSIEPKEGTAFAWRDRLYMLQIQAWWLDDDDDTDFYLDWVKGFRDVLENDTEGAFINFPDKSIPIDHYYDHAYSDLQKLKAIFDENNIMRFGMSIEPKKET